METSLEVTSKAFVVLKCLRCCQFLWLGNSGKKTCFVKSHFFPKKFSSLGQEEIFYSLERLFWGLAVKNNIKLIITYRYLKQGRLGWGETSGHQMWPWCWSRAMARHKQGCSSGGDQALELRAKAAPTGWSSAFAGLSQAAGPLEVGFCFAPEPLYPHLALWFVLQHHSVPQLPHL